MTNLTVVYLEEFCTLSVDKIIRRKLISFLRKWLKKFQFSAWLEDFFIGLMKDPKMGN